MKNLMKLGLCLLAVLFAFNANAKVSKSELLGAWTLTFNMQGAMVISTFDFNADDTMTQFFMTNCTSPKMNIIAEAKGSYTLEDDTITFQVSTSDVNFSVFEIEGLPDNMKGMAQQQILNQMMNSDQKLTDVKIEGNTLTAKAGGQTLTFQRSK